MVQRLANLQRMADALSVAQQVQAAKHPTIQARTATTNDDLIVLGEAEVMRGRADRAGSDSGGRNHVLQRLASPRTLTRSIENIEGDAALGDTNPRSSLPADFRALQTGSSAVQRLTTLQGLANDTIQFVSDPATREEAIGRHQNNQDRVYKIVNDALASPVPESHTPSRAKLLKNTAESIAGRKILLYVMSRTDAAPAFRVGNGISYFDDTKYYPDRGGTYGHAPDINTLELEGDANAHANHHGEIKIFDPNGLTDEDIITMLIHETQHQMDQHRAGNVFERAAVEGASSHALNGFQTEFRAYWLGGIMKETPHLNNFYDRLGHAFMPANNSRKVPSGSLLKFNYTTRFKNQRQEKIFWHMWDSTSYEYIKTAFQASEAFRDMVYSFEVPVGGNLLNSIRIENLQDSIRQLGAYRGSVEPATAELERLEREKRNLKPEKEDETRGDGGALEDLIRTARTSFNFYLEQVETQERLMIRAARALDHQDLEFLNDEAKSVDFWNFVENRLGPKEAQRIRGLIKNKRMDLAHERIYGKNPYLFDPNGM